MVKKFEYNIPKEKGIYMIWFKTTEKVYIGSSKNLYKRFGEHYNMLKNNKHHNNKLQNYVNKHGLNDIEFCTHIIDNNLTTKELRLLEEKEINFYNSYYKGFNLTDKTLSNEGYKHTDKSKQILSEKARVRQSNPEVKERLKFQNRGIKNPCSKLSNDDINFIRSNTLLSRLELSKLFKVNRRTIDRVITKVTYK